MISAELFFLCLITLVAALIVWRTVRFAATARHEEQICTMLNDSHFPTGFVGYSVLCCNVRELKQIECVLECEYQRYEVIISLNTSLDVPMLEQIIKRYKMVKVSHPMSHDAASYPITNLYRSRQRGYRRLVVLDSEATSPFDALNAALSVAAYDYIIPLWQPSSLRGIALQYMASLLSQREFRQMELIRCYGIYNCAIYQRAALFERDGFTASTTSRTPRNTTLSLNILALRPIEEQPRRWGTIAICATIIVTTSTIISLLLSPIAALAWLLTALLAFVAAKHTLAMGKIEKCSVGTILYLIRNLTRFFRSRKFTF